MTKPWSKPWQPATSAEMTSFPALRSVRRNLTAGVATRFCALPHAAAYAAAHAAAWCAVHGARGRAATLHRVAGCAAPRALQRVVPRKHSRNFRTPRPVNVAVLARPGKPMRCKPTALASGQGLITSPDDARRAWAEEIKHSPRSVPKRTGGNGEGSPTLENFENSCVESSLEKSRWASR